MCPQSSSLLCHVVHCLVDKHLHIKGGPKGASENRYVLTLGIVYLLFAFEAGSISLYLEICSHVEGPYLSS